MGKSAEAEAVGSSMGGGIQAAEGDREGEGEGERERERETHESTQLCANFLAVASQGFKLQAQNAQYSRYNKVCGHSVHYGIWEVAITRRSPRQLRNSRKICQRKHAICTKSRLATSALFGYSSL